MYFLNPLLLLGATAISVPIIIHLLNRRRTRRIEWAAMRWLRASIEKNERRLEIEDIILLILRCLLLILLALALARPTLRGALGSLGNLGLTPSTALILLDNSYSMDATDGVQSRFDKARKAAEETLDSLPSGSSVAVWLVSDTVRPIIPEPTRDLALARKIIRESRLSDHASNLLPCLQQSIESLRNKSGARKELYVVTDGQALAWQRWADVLQLLNDAKRTIRTRVLLVGDTDEQNLGLSDLRLAGGLPSVNQPLRFEAQVTNYGREDARDVRVTLSVNGDPPSDEGAIEFIPAGTAKSVSLFAKLRTDGFHGVTARLADDRLRADNRRSAVVHAMKELRVLLVDGTPGRDARESGVFFLRQALVPVPAVEAPQYFIKPIVVTPSELPAARLDGYDVVILSNVFDYNPDTATSLQQFVTRGGGLIVFPGPNCNRAFYNSTLAPLLPATLGEARGDAEKQESIASLQPKGYTHPIVTLWNDPAAGTLATARFYRYYPLTPSTNGAPVTVLRFADESPAVIEQSLGLGRVLLFNSTANTAWNDLPVRPAFVPLLHRALAVLLIRRDENLNIKVGEPFTRQLGLEYLGKETTISTEPRSYGRVELVKNVPTLRHLHTDNAGVYDVSVTSDPPLALRFATQASATESSLKPLTVAELKQLGQAAQVLHYPQEMALRTRIEQEAVGSEVWWTVALAALLLGAAETLLAQRFSRSK
jgi:hypothetical protein